MDLDPFNMNGQLQGNPNHLQRTEDGRNGVEDRQSAIGEGNGMALPETELGSNRHHRRRWAGESLSLSP